MVRWWFRFGRSVGWVIGVGEDDGWAVGFGHRRDGGDVVQGITQVADVVRWCAAGKTSLLHAR